MKDVGNNHEDLDEFGSNTTSLTEANKNPSPHERAELIVRRLEKFIREGRTEKGGINFRKWQEMAVLEIANSIRDSEKYLREDQRFFTRVLSLIAASLLTIGTWGTVLAADATADRQVVALILIISGGLLISVLAFWGIRRLERHQKKGRRRYHLKRVKNFDRQLATLDKDMEKRLKKLREEIKEMTKLN